MKDVVVVPTYNERENIRELIPKLFSLLPTVHCMVVDDNSPDGTADQVREFMKTYPNLRLLSRERKEGLGKAYLHAFRTLLDDGTVERIIIMDADFSHDMRDIPIMLKKSVNADMVIGSRYISGGQIEGWELWRKLLSRFGNYYCHFITGMPIYDATSGFNLILAPALRKIDLTSFDSSGYSFQIELKYRLWKNGARLQELPIKFHNRREGESKISNHIVGEGLVTPWKLRFGKGRQDSVVCPLCTGRANLFMHKNKYALYACPQCGLKFVYPTPDAAFVYSEDYFVGAHNNFGYTNYDRDKEPMTPVFEEYIRRITKHVAPGALLDVGAATVFFVNIAKRNGFAAEGVEISPYAAARAREKGLTVMTGTLSDVSAWSQFDVITMLDVLEHVGDPRGELARAHALLRPQGLLVLNTPDAGSSWARLMGRRWHLIVPPEHLSYFNRHNLSVLLAEQGFVLEETTSIGKSFTLAYIFKTLYAWQGFVLWRYLERLCMRGFLQRIVLPLNLRDNMFVIARKI